ncbi:hypothetical protein L218DRAFT_838599, partial [Marasmius fiardii PR-910]
AVTVSFSNTAVIDCVLSITLISHLYKANKRIDWYFSHYYVIVAYVINSGAFASLLSITCPLAFGLNSTSLVFYVLRTVLVGLYANSLLAMLNAQHYLEDSKHERCGCSGSFRTPNFLLYNGRGFDRPSRPKSTINQVGLPLF